MRTVVISSPVATQSGYGHHAREVITYTSLIYYVEWLCINYNKNKIAKHILDTKDLWIIPCLNPDGLVYNQKIAPNGGGLFRKNRRVTTNNSYLSKSIIITNLTGIIGDKYESYYIDYLINRPLNKKVNNLYKRLINVCRL